MLKFSVHDDMVEAMGASEVVAELLRDIDLDLVEQIDLQRINVERIYGDLATLRMLQPPNDQPIVIWDVKVARPHKRRQPSPPPAAHFIEVGFVNLTSKRDLPVRHPAREKGVREISARPIPASAIVYEDGATSSDEESWSSEAVVAADIDADVAGPARGGQLAIFSGCSL